MLIDLVDLIGKDIEVEISGGKLHKGTLLDSGLDIIVVYDAKNHSYLYIPFTHVQRLKETILDEEYSSTEPPSNPIDTDVISFRKALTYAKGMFVQVYVSSNKSVYGYVTSIMNDYFVLQSPVYKTLFISMNHVKWLIPCPPKTTPYSLKSENIDMMPKAAPISRSFDEQLKKFENQLVIIDGGDHNEKVGLLQKIGNNKITLITAESEVVIRNLEHIKTVQLT
ncbi:DUF2642 domain-containing protein [Paenibacillus sp. BSR1-1]|uniref:DUF2642 domain-containing protein n=1 Tax=Paenibacillus sp. BSR1-1 TaxID=3020845 RepID=UPI0025AFB1B5|nr:DUF2642 domain-containing protein [Paenibacillus sp. BSR1-1]MDN3016872.1 DUF2642 domain-containing protein [Paenibacillus sp. BSR1-1]